MLTKKPKIDPSVLDSFAQNSYGASYKDLTWKQRRAVRKVIKEKG